MLAHSQNEQENFGLLKLGLIPILYEAALNPTPYKGEAIRTKPAYAGS
jgi:hypothetical protein